MAGINIDAIKLPSNPTPGGPKRPWIDFLSRDIQLFKGISHKNKEDFYRQLSILLGAGVDLKSALDLLVKQQKGKVREITERIKDELVQGSALSQSLQHQDVFTPYEYHSIQIGEETGRLAAVVGELALFFQKRIKQQRQLISALMYPAMVILTSFLAVFFMVNYIVPMFADIFQRSGNELPKITQAIITFSTFFRTYFFPFVVLMASLITWFYFQKNRTWFRKASSALLLRLPVFGPLIRKIFLARFCNSMALLTVSKVSLIRAIRLSRQMVDFYPIEVSLSQIEDQILHGQTLHKSLAAFPIYDSKLVSLVSIGEEVNQLPVFFEKVAAQYNEDVEHQSALLSSVLEPFIIIFLGVFVGLILIAMYLPLFQLGNNFG